MENLYCSACDVHTDPDGGMAYTDDNNHYVEIELAECPSCGATLARVSAPPEALHTIMEAEISGKLGDLLRLPEWYIVATEIT